MLKRDRLGSARVTLNPVVIFPAPLIQQRYQTSRAVSSLNPVFSHCLEKNLITTTQKSVEQRCVL